MHQLDTIPHAGKIYSQTEDTLFTHIYTYRTLAHPHGTYFNNTAHFSPLNYKLHGTKSFLGS